jgi:hypothetical protein
MEPSRGPTPTWNWDQAEIYFRLQFQPLAELSSAKGYVNDWLTLTNQVPPVNDAQDQSQLPKDR